MIAVQKSVTVPQAPLDAFDLFVDHMAEWWPLATHSVGLEAATSVVFEHGVGGRIVETYAGGRTTVWGTVTEWDPPARVRFSWHPGRSEAEATEVELRFTAVPGGTQVELVHTGWDSRPDAPEARASYESGWEYVLGFFAAAAG